MNLPVVSHANFSKGNAFAVKASRGFTLVELLLVAALMLVVGSFMFPLGISFYRTQMLNETSEGLSSTLRRAQSFAVSSKDDSVYGVRILENSYVFFKGETYATRIVSEDETYHVASTINITGPTEITFESLSGLPTATGTIEVSTGDRTVYVGILSSGVVYH